VVEPVVVEPVVVVPVLVEPVVVVPVLVVPVLVEPDLVEPDLCLLHHQDQSRALAELDVELVAATTRVRNRAAWGRNIAS
jgi:hypothetical protein